MKRAREKRRLLLNIVARKNSGMSLALVLIVMLVGLALTGAAFWIVENATRTNRLAQNNARLYDTAQAGIQRGLVSLDMLVQSFTSKDKMLGVDLVLSSQGALPPSWWQDELCVRGKDGVLFSQDFYLNPWGQEVSRKSISHMERGDIRGTWQVFSLQYQVNTGSGKVQYVKGLPPQIPVKVVLAGEAMENILAKQSYEEGHKGSVWGGSFLIVGTALLRGKGALKEDMTKSSSLGVIVNKFR